MLPNHQYHELNIVGINVPLFIIASGSLLPFSNNTTVLLSLSTASVVSAFDRIGYRNGKGQNTI